MGLVLMTSARAGLSFVNQAGGEVGVNRHLLTRHRVQGETGGHFRNTARALGDDHEVNHHQNQKHHRAHHVVPLDHKIAESLNDISGVTIHQNQPGGSDVERQTIKRHRK